MTTSLWAFFTDPVLRAPTLGSMLMCSASALVGVLVFLRKRSLLGETLSHAAYPGVVLSIVAIAFFLPQSQEIGSFILLAGAFVSAILGLWCIDLLAKHVRVSSDAALCLVLSSFFGVGVLIASRIQITHALLYKQIQLFLYGQAATMTDVHIVLYGVLCAAVILALWLLYRPLEVLYFDRSFASTVGIPVALLDGILVTLLGLAIVIGMRSVGVVLMSGMLIAPAIAVRPVARRLSTLFFWAAGVGLLSGFCGNYFSVALPLWLGEDFSLPTGPMILLTAAGLCIAAQLLAPRQGLFSRYLRIARFRVQCRLENILKSFWKEGEGKPMGIGALKAMHHLSVVRIYLLLWRLYRQGWIEKIRGRFLLTPRGAQRAAHIVRLHRLWEVYLVDYLGQGADKVHHSAEEMEHVITPALEKELTELLKNPKRDPHSQPIPQL